MNTVAHKTSIESINCYHDMRLSGTISKRQYEVMRFMVGRHSVTRRQIANGLGWDTGSAAGRVNELVDMDYLVKLGTVRCSKTDVMVGLVGLPEKQGELI